MKLLLLGTNITTGGAQRVLLDLAGWLHAKDIKVTAAFFYDRDGLLSEWQSQFPFDLVCMDAWHQTDNIFQRGVRLVRGWFRLLRFMRAEHFSGILTFTHDSNILGLPAALLSGIPKRYGSHHVRYPSLSKLKIHLHSWVINSSLSSGLICVSTFTKEQALEEGINPEKISKIYNGIDPDTVKFNLEEQSETRIRVEEDQRIVLAVGRLVQQKGHEYLIRSAPEVMATLPEVSFYIAGDGPLLSSLSSLITSLKINDHFHLLGNRKDVPALLADADLFVLPSIFEGLPISLLEAMAAGLPVICTDIPATRDVIEEGINGVFVPPKDAGALSKAIIGLLSDQKSQEKLALKGKQLIQETFSLAKMGQQYLNLFEE